MGALGGGKRGAETPGERLRGAERFGTGRSEAFDDAPLLGIVEAARERGRERGGIPRRHEFAELGRYISSAPRLRRDEGSPAQALR